MNEQDDWMEAYDFFGNDPEPEEEYETKGQRREARRERGRMGMVRHSAPNVRPMKMPKGKVNYR